MSIPPNPETLSAQTLALAAAERGARAYRWLFFAAVGAGLVAAWAAWTNRTTSTFQEPTAYALARDKQFPFVVDAYGYKYQGTSGNIIDEHVLRFGAWEKWRLFFVRDYLAKAGIQDATVIDVGANTGHHALFYSRHAARVLAFEPFPPVLAAFKQNLALNPHIQNVQLFEIGLGDKEAELPFVAPVEENHGHGSFRTAAPQYKDSKEYERKLKIVVGDDYLKDQPLGPVAFVKVDVEGYEGPVLMGLRQLMAKHRPLLEIEVSAPPLGTIGSFDEFRALLPADYEFFVLPWTLDGVVKGTYQLAPLDGALLGKGGQLEIIACPKERLAALPR